MIGTVVCKKERGIFIRVLSLQDDGHRPLLNSGPD